MKDQILRICFLGYIIKRQIINNPGLVYNAWYSLTRIIVNKVTWIIVKWNYDKISRYTFFLNKQSIFDPRPENCLSFSKKSPQKIV